MATTRVSVDVQFRIREEVLEKISRIDPYLRPVLASIGRRNATNTKVEWTLQQLARPTATNAKIHGFATSFAAADTTKRTQDLNYTQLHAKPAAVDLSMQAVYVYGLGVGGELNEQKALKTVELLNDFEYMLVSNNAKTQPLPDSSQAGQSAGMQTFLATNVITGGIGDFPETEMTPGIWTRIQIKIKKNGGGMPNKAFMGLEALDTVAGWVKQVTREVGNDGRRLTQVVEQIRGLVGLVDLVYHPALTGVVLLIETARFEVAWLREPKWHPYPEGISDYSGGVYKAEGCLVSLAEQASGMINGLSYQA